MRILPRFHVRVETRQNVTLHIKAIYHESEQQERATCKEYLQVQISKKQ
jgi:hypothetical protein